MNNSLLVIAELSLFFISTILVRVFCQARLKRLLDIPNARSAHRESVPRGGGIIFVILWIISLGLGYKWGIVSLSFLQVFLPSTLMISLLGFWDDFCHLGFKIRLLIQILIAGFTLYFIGDVSSLHLVGNTACHLGWGAVVLGLLGLVWSTNAFNFMDGLDGFAASQAIFVFGMGGLLFWLSGQPAIAGIVWAVPAGVGGFLVWNWPKAKVFMGDAGSYCLGFLIALFALVGDVWFRIPIFLWVILYGVFWFDATLTVLRRIYFKDNIAMAHREHAYQRLHRRGYSSRQILMGLFGINALLALITLTLYFHPELFGWGVGLALLILSLAYLVAEQLKPMVKSR